MTKNLKGSSNDENPSLGRQISLAASQLDERKNSAMSLGSSLRSRIKSGFTSPAGLSIAFFTGFLAADWIHRPKMKTESASEENTVSTDDQSQSSTMSNARLLLKMALSGRMLWNKVGPGHSSGVRQRTDEYPMHE